MPPSPRRRPLAPSSSFSPSDDLVIEKRTKIKTWVKNRLVKLEQQNERLRERNLRCNVELQMLKSFTDRTKQWKEENAKMSAAMSRSVTGTLMRNVDARTSDDSGLTSDDPSEKIKGDIMSKSTMEVRRASISSTPRAQRKGVRLRTSANREEGSVEGDSTDSSPWEERPPKPIPAPRIPKKAPPSIERDSIASFADDYEFDCDEEFDEIQEPTTSRQHAEYVNLSDFCSIRDDVHIYSDIVKSPVSSPPRPPEHAKMRLWEFQLHETAEACLSLGEEGVSSASSLPSVSPALRASLECEGTPPRGSVHSKASFSSPRHGISPDGERVPVSMRGSLHLDYDTRLPPDLRTSLVAPSEVGEKAGYWTQAGESRLKSLKRRWVVLRHGQLLFYRNNKTREVESLSRLSLNEIKSVAVVNEKGTAYSFQLKTESGESTMYSTESERATAEWVQAITAAIKGQTLRELASRSSPLDASISSLVTRVHCGHTKRFVAALVKDKLLFLKGHDTTLPSHIISLSGAHVAERHTGSSDEYSGSSDEQLEGGEGRGPGKRKQEYSISIHVAQEDPTYMVLSSVEEKEKWLYFLRAASGHSSLRGTPFEVLLQRMLADGMPPGSALWKDLLLTSCEEPPTDTAMSVDKEHKKKGVELAKACHLFVSVLMRPTAVQYHEDLAQNILQMAVTREEIRNELYAQLIRLTSGGMPYALQGWKLLALALPLFAPAHYALLWLLRKHLAKSSLSSISEDASMAGYCECALERSLKMGGRVEGPSRVEVHSILTRDPTTTKFPHSICVRLPNGEYQVVELDGSTEVGQCLSSLCLKLGMRPALLSGYAMYIDDPLTNQLQLLKGKQKVCDCLSVWERKQRDVHRGKIPPESSARLHLRQRHYWRHLAASETPIERAFLVARMGEEIKEGRVPLSAQLADKLLALFAQLTFGDAPEEITEEQVEYVLSRFYPRKMVEMTSDRILRSSLTSSWRELCGSGEGDCIRVILQVLRKWPLFGCHFHSAGERLHNNRPVLIALHDTSLHVVDSKQLSILRSIPYGRLHSFGDFQGDFMVTVERQLAPDAHPEETSKERVTFSMGKENVEELTLHLAEYIRCQKLVWKVSK